MRQRESISEPPLDKLEQIRQKFSKQLTKVKAKGFIECGVKKLIEKNSFLEKLQSINSFDEDERSLLKSIQCDVQIAIKRYQQRIEQISQLQIERSSMRSCAQEVIGYLNTPKDNNNNNNSLSLFDSRENTNIIKYESAKIEIQNNNNKKKDKNILTSTKSNMTFKIINQKKIKNKKINEYENNRERSRDQNILKKKQSISREGFSQKSISTRQPSVKEITINLEQRRSTERISKNYTSRSKYSTNRKLIQ